MKKSRYNYIIRNKNEYILFNSVSGAIISLDEDFYKKFKNLEISLNEIQQLEKLGFIVEDNCNEFKRIIENNKINYDKQDTKIYTICPTTKCNARCFYCFEHGKKHFNMSKEIADNVIKFITEDVKGSNSKNVCISWFGGEPLLKENIINYITAALLDDEYFKNNISYSAKITTNGILINENIIKKLKTWKIDTIQITLDGFRKEYEKRKAYIDEVNAFDKIISIIKKLCDNKIATKIRLNYDEKNYQSIINLINFIGEDFSAEQKQFVKFYPAKLENTQNCAICNTKADKNYLKIFKELFKYGINQTFETLNLKYRFAHCLAESEYNFVIGADGEIYKCNEVVDNKKYSFGDVINGINKEIKHRKIDTKCKRCKFFPICQGGCVMRNTDVDSSSKCQMQKFILADILKLYINK